MHTSVEARTSRLQVVHVGIYGDYPGGMAQVVNQYLRWQFSGVDVSAILSTRRARDPMALFLTALASIKLVVFKLRHPHGIAVFHLSERGSFLREGGLLVLGSMIGLGVVAHLHGAQFEQFARRHSRLVRFVLRRAGAVGALSQQSLDTVRDVVGASVNVRLVPNGVALPDQKTLEAKENIAIFGGELGKRKGVDLLIEAWERTRPRDGSWRLLLVGPASASIGELPNLINMEVLGPKSHKELLDLLRKARIAVLPSRDEALPMFLLEAMASSCALIATDVGQVSSICSPKNGVLIPPGDVDALANALAEMMGQPPARTAGLGAAGRETIARLYSGDAVRLALTALWASASRTST